MANRGKSSGSGGRVQFGDGSGLDPSRALQETMSQRAFAQQQYQNDITPQDWARMSRAARDQYVQYQEELRQRLSRQLNEPAVVRPFAAYDPDRVRETQELAEMYRSSEPKKSTLQQLRDSVEEICSIGREALAI